MITATLLIVTVCLVSGCSSKPTKPRKINLPAQIIGNWKVKDPPKPERDPKMPKDYVPPPPTYDLTFTSEGTFALNLNGKTHQGTYIISGATIQLISYGQNYTFDLGDKEKDDTISGDSFTWSRVTKGAYNPPVTPTTPSTNGSSPNTPVTPDTPDNPVPAPPPPPNR